METIDLCSDDEEQPQPSATNPGCFARDSIACEQAMGASSTQLEELQGEHMKPRKRRKLAVLHDTTYVDHKQDIAVDLCLDDPCASQPEASGRAAYGTQASQATQGVAAFETQASEAAPPAVRDGSMDIPCDPPDSQVARFNKPGAAKGTVNADRQELAAAKLRKQQEAAEKKQQAAAERQRKQAEKAAEKAAKAAEKAALSRSKADEARAKGAKALEEIEAVVDTGLVLSKHGRHFVDALQRENLKVSLEPGKLQGFDLITWRRHVPSNDKDAADGVTAVPHVLVVLPPEKAADLLANESAVAALLHSIATTFGPVSASLLLLGFERHLVNRDRREFDASIRAGVASTAGQLNKNALMERLLMLIFKYQGVSYRDVVDEAQGAEHVVAVTLAIARQPYKGGDDWLTVHKLTHKQTQSMRGRCEDEGMSKHEGAFARALHALGTIGIKDACAISRQFPGLRSLTNHMLSQPEAAARGAIACLKNAGGRNVGPVAAAKLYNFLTCEDPDAPF